MRFPLDPFIIDYLEQLNVAATQLAPNYYQALINYWVLWRKHTFPYLTIEEFKNLYQMKKLLHCHGSYYFQPWKSNRLGIEKLLKIDKTWKYELFLGDWSCVAEDLSSLDLVLVPQEFRVLIIWEPPNISFGQHLNIKFILFLDANTHSQALPLTDHSLVVVRWFSFNEINSHFTF